MVYVLIHRYPLSEFLFCGLEGVKPLLLPVVEKTSWPIRLLRRVEFYFGRNFNVDLFYNFFPAEIYRTLKKMKCSDSLIYVGESSQMCFILSRICKNAGKKTAYFWNPCSSVNNCQKKINDMRQTEFDVATFDLEDAKKFNLKFVGQLYRKQEKYECKEEYDFFFCGKDKGRKKFIERVKKLVTSLGKVEFIVPEKKDAFEYGEYIEKVKKSRILFDFVQKNQSGLTIRVMEALFFQKKLITDNKHIANYDFFNISNILIIDEKTSSDDIAKFMSTPFIPYKDSVLDSLTVENVLKKMC